MTENKKQSVFVLMPLDGEFDLVYKHFLKPVLEESGFDVDQAADIQSQQNILRDIIRGIKESDLILADLTNANPNVFYELGIAHAFRKPVVLVTQDIEDVPFDLKSYRLIEYSTHFVKIEAAKAKLSSYGKGFSEGKLPFGSPITDFYPSGDRQSQVLGAGLHNTTEESDNALKQTAEEGERGFIDHLVDINEGYTSIGSIMEGVTGDLEELTKSIETANTDITRIASNPSTSSLTAVQRVSRRLADRIGIFNRKLEQANSEYAEIAQGIEDSLEFTVSFYRDNREQPEVTDTEVEEQILQLDSLRDSSIQGRDSLNDLADIMDGLPRLERRLNREVTRGSEEIRIMAGNIDKTIASISRALNYNA